MRQNTDDARVQPGRSAPVALVVEDDAMVRQALARMLCSLGFDPIEAVDGAAAVDLLKERGTIDLLLTDVVMPGAICGRKLAAMARRLRPTLPVLLITGYAAGWHRIDAALADGEVLLAKPITRADLRIAVDNALDHSNPSTRDVPKPGVSIPALPA